MGCSNFISQSESFNEAEVKNFILRMERTACLGNCPVFKLEILQNGNLSFEKLAFSDKDLSYTKSSGKIKKTLDKEKINRLITEIVAADFFSLSTEVDESGNCATDHSTIILSVQLNEKSREIKHDLGCVGTADLKKLENLENKINEIVETNKLLQEIK